MLCCTCLRRRPARGGRFPRGCSRCRGFRPLAGASSHGFSEAHDRRIGYGQAGADSASSGCQGTRRGGLRDDQGRTRLLRVPVQHGGCEGDHDPPPAADTLRCEDREDRGGGRRLEGYGPCVGIAGGRGRVEAAPGDQFDAAGTPGALGRRTRPSTAPGCAGYPTGRRTGAACTASALPAERRTCN